MEKFTNPKRGHARVGRICIPLRYLSTTNEHLLPLLLISFFTLFAGSVQAQYTFSNAGTIGNLATFTASGGRSTPVMIDLNADGKWDFISGNANGTFLYYQNIGTAKYSPATPGTPLWSAGTPLSNVSGVLDVGSFSTPALADIDGDGDADLFSGDNLGRFHYYKNTGGVFTEQLGLNNPLDEDEFSVLFDVGSGSAVGFIDTDGDGDLDAVVGNSNGEFRHLENEGDENNPYFPRYTDADGVTLGVQVSTTANGNPVPMNLTVPELNATVCVVDMNCDGLFAFVSGTRGGSFQFRDVNPMTGFWTDLPTTNHPLLGKDISAAPSEFSYPAFGDLDGDGDQDAISGKVDGKFVYFQNQTCNTPPTFTGIVCGSTADVTLDVTGDTEHVLGTNGDAFTLATAAPGICIPVVSSSASFSYTPDLVTCANIGTPVTVTLQAVDDFTGVKSSATACQIHVIVHDDTDPVAVCDPSGNYVVEVGQFNVTLGTLPVSAIESGSTDNCTPNNLLQKTLSYSYSTTLPFDCSDIGDSFEDITLSVVDGSGNSSSCSVNVVVEDNYPPVPDVAVLAPLSREKCDYDNGTLGEFVAGEEIPVPTATDRCSIAINTAVRVSVNGGAFVAVTDPMNWTTAIVGGFTLTGSYTLTWEYKDFYGNTSTQNQTLVIGPPQLVFTLCPTGTLPDVIVPVLTPSSSCFFPATWASIGGTEICGLSTPSSITSSHVSGASFMVGTTTVFYTANDGNGHIANCSFHVVVQPTVTVSAPMAGYINTTVPLMPSSFTLPSGFTVSALSGQCGRVITWTGTPTVSSYVTCANPVTVTAVPASGSFFAIGTTTVNFIATDAKGNTYNVGSFSVTVNDLPPTITCPQPSITVDAAPPFCGQLVTIPNAIVSDNCPGVTLINSYSGPAPVTNGLFASIYDMYGNNVPTPVVYTAIDANLPIPNTAQCTVYVYVRDTQKPSFLSTCPNDMTVIEDDLICGEDVTLPFLLPIDNCGGLTLEVEISEPSGNEYTATNGGTFNFAEGTSVVTYLATDQAGLTSLCGFKITVIDNIAPNVYCPLNTINRTTVTNCADVLSSNAYGGQILTSPSSGCGAPTLTYRLASNPLVALPPTYQFPRSNSPYNLIAVATDPSGNSSSCPFSILVSDLTAPVMTNCPANITINDTNGGCSQPVTWAGPVFTDDCDASNLLVVTRNHQPGDVFPVGITPVFIVATDLSGNTSPGCSFSVIVLDKTPPAITTCPTNQNLVVTNNDATCVKTFAYSFTVTDDCGPYSVTVSSSGSYTNTASTYSGSVLVAPGFPSTVTYTATDLAGNTSTCSFTVTAVDQQGPFFAYCPPSQTITTTSCLGANATWFPPIIYDFCGNGWNLGLPTRASGSLFAPGGPQLVSYTATDNLGNSSVCSFGITVIVAELVPPVITCPPSITVNSTNCVDATVSAGTFTTMATATDNCAMHPTNPISIISPTLPTAFPIGTSGVVWMALDAAGNSAFCTQTVVVRDDTDPSLTCPSPYTAQLQLNQTAFDICANAGLLGLPIITDACGNAPGPATLAPQQCQFVPGSHPIYWQVTDNAGNTGSCVQTLVVVGAQACTPTTPSFSGGSNCGSVTPFVLPNANCPASVTVTAAQLGLSATDNCGNALVIPNKTFNVSVTGTQTVTFTATVGANTVNCTRTVSVTCNAGPCTPNAVPTMAGCGGTVSVNANASCQGVVASFGVTASDNCASRTVTASNNGPFPLGNTIVTFTASNTVGSNSCTKTVTVTDVTNPTFLSCPSDVTIEPEPGEEFALSINLEIPVATDNCSISSILQAVGTPDKLFGDGEVVTWIATDGSGNAAECQQNIIVSVSVTPEGCADALGIEIASDGGGGDLFGYSVDIDGSRAIVGAPYDDNGKGINSGAAYIFEKDGLGNWVQVAKLLVPDGDADDLFGESVAIDGGLVIVGASKYNGKGAAFIFSGSGATWTVVKKLVASDGLANDDFGVSVDITATHAIVGAPNDDVTKVNQGSVYIFASASSWNEIAKRVASDGDTNDNYGISVSIDGSFAVVGSRYDDDFGTNSGSAYVLNGGSSWNQLQKLTPSDGAAGDYFGSSVAISGIHIIVGSYLDDYGLLNNAGSAYVFEDGGLSWTEVAKLIPSDAAVADQFGISVSIESGIAVVGSHFDDDMGTNSGSAYVFTEGSGWSQVNKLTGASVVTNDNFGRSVAIGGSSIVIGAYKDDISGLDQGSAYFFGCSNNPLREATKDRTSATASTSGQVRCFPNPSTDVVNIDVTLAEEESVQVIVSDISGRVISTVFDNKMSGENRLQWEGKQFGNGMYFIRIQSASLREVVPVVIVR